MPCKTKRKKQKRSSSNPIKRLTNAGTDLVIGAATIQVGMGLIEGFKK